MMMQFETGAKTAQTRPQKMELQSSREVSRMRQGGETSLGGDFTAAAPTAALSPMTAAQGPVQGKGMAEKKQERNQNKVLKARGELQKSGKSWLASKDTLTSATLSEKELNDPSVAKYAGRVGGNFNENAMPLTWDSSTKNKTLKDIYKTYRKAAYVRDKNYMDDLKESNPAAHTYESNYRVNRNLADIGIMDVGDFGEIIPKDIKEILAPEVPKY